MVKPSQDLTRNLQFKNSVALKTLTIEENTATMTFTFNAKDRPQISLLETVDPVLHSQPIDQVVQDGAQSLRKRLLEMAQLLAQKYKV